MSTLRDARKAAGYSLRQLAEASGVSRGLISRLETGERPIMRASAGTVRAISRALGVSMESLLDGQDDGH